MLSFIGRSMVQKIITLFFVSIVSFLIIHLAPGEPSQVDPTNPKFTPEMVEKFREAFHLDEPLYVQYLYFYGDLFSGKTMHERHLADEDSEFYSYAKRLKAEVLPAKPSRIFILHESLEHDYERLKTQFYLLPHNIYNYGRFPQKEQPQCRRFYSHSGNCPRPAIR